MNNIIKNRIKQKNGITLIALVITIIVLLILAGVSIAMLTGQNGILTQANNAKDETEQANAKEKLESAVIATMSQSKRGTLDADKLVTEITNNYGGTATKTGTGFPVNTTVDGKSFTVDSDGNVELAGSKPQITREGIKVGDYVNYTPNVASTSYSLLGTQSGSDSDQTINQESLTWRVLRKNADGSIDLIADPTFRSVGFERELGYNNGVYLLNDICEKLYSNTGKNVTARSVNLDDMEKWLTDAGKNARANYSKAAVKYGETKIYTEDNVYRPDIYGKTENENDKYYSTPTTNTYTGSHTLDAKQTYYNISINSTNYGDGAKVLSSSSTYWVAARFVNCRSGYATFGLRRADRNMDGISLCRSYNYRGNSFHFLRPVVSLGSDVQITPSTGTNGPSNKHTIEW